MDPRHPYARRMIRQAVRALATGMEKQDVATAGHQRRTARLAGRMARRMGLGHESVRTVIAGALLHDMGKMAVPASILLKPHRLSVAEYAVVREHPAAGYDIVRQLDFGLPVAEVVLQHHERLDGRGYPEGLRNGAIRLESRLVAAADVADSVLSRRAYQGPTVADTVFEVLAAASGTHLDPEAVDACCAVLRDDPAAWLPRR